MSGELTIRGHLLRPNGRQAAIVTSIYNYGGYSLDLTSRILDSEEYEKVILEEPLKPYIIQPKTNKFRNLVGDVNRKIEIVGFLGFHEHRCFWMARCRNCIKYSIREHGMWIDKKHKHNDEFCYNCDDKEEREIAKSVMKWKHKPSKNPFTCGNLLDKDPPKSMFGRALDVTGLKEMLVREFADGKKRRQKQF